jgi:hypothetical protein
LRLQERYELASELRDRYAAAGRPERGEILNGYCLATGYDRKPAMRVLRGRQLKPVSRLGRPRRRRYGLQVRQALKVLWEASGYICSDRLQPFLPTLRPLLERHRQFELEPTTRDLLVRASVATVERNLVDRRRGLGRASCRRPSRARCCDAKSRWWSAGGKRWTAWVSGNRPGFPQRRDRGGALDLHPLCHELLRPFNNCFQRS